jgi:hypothetical protein
MLARDEVVTKPRRNIQIAKFMFTAMWNPLAFQVTGNFPTGARMNSEYFATDIPAQLEKICPAGKTGHAKRLIGHMDNCSIHRNGATEDYTK